MERYELAPVGSQKSFNGKAYVWDMGNGLKVLQSYQTLVAYIDNKGFHKLWSGYSATTMKHINSFVGQNARSGGKAWWISLKTESLRDSEQYNS